MPKLINQPSDGEILLVDSLFYGLITHSFELTKTEILNIPKISNFERINFYLFKKYTLTIIDGIETFEEKLKEELKETCLKIKKYCKE